MSTFSNIAFIGGIHGVGKSTICQDICHQLKMEHLSASELLKWKDINDDELNKKVKNVPVTQNRLLLGLKETVQKEYTYLLDGHYCLLNQENEIVKISLDTFREINPFSLNIIIGEISLIRNRLKSRDSKLYNYDLLERLQNEELAHAKHLSKTLGITLNIGTQNDYSEIINSLRKSLV